MINLFTYANVARNEELRCFAVRMRETVLESGLLSPSHATSRAVELEFWTK